MAQMDPVIQRKFMIDCQVKPNDVYDENIIDAIESVSRERFVPDEYKTAAYTDMNIPLGEDKFLMDPMIFARMLQSVYSQDNGYALVIGSNLGYSMAVLSNLYQTVIGIEDNEDMKELANKNLKEAGCINTAVFHSDLINGYQEEAPYNIIFVEGAVAHMPAVILNQLKDNGRLVCVKQDSISKMGQAMLIIRQGDDFLKTTLFDTKSFFLNGFEPKSEFKF